MKTLETLEQEAKEAREEAIKEVSQYVPNAIEVTDKLIRAVLSQAAFDIEETRLINERIAKMEASQDQKEVDADGWITWNGDGHDCPIPENLKIEARFANGDINNGEAGQYRWCHVGNGYDLIAYRIVK